MLYAVEFIVKVVNWVIGLKHDTEGYRLGYNRLEYGLGYGLGNGLGLNYRCRIRRGEDLICCARHRWLNPRTVNY